MITYQITPGSTDVSVVVRIVDSTDGTPETGVVWNTAGIDMQYRREGAASTAITEATLAALTTAHTDGGFLHIGNGYYRLDVPDAAFAAGVAGVLIHGTVTGMVVIGCYVQLEGQVDDIYDRIGAPAGASIAADLVTIDNFVDGLETTIGAAGAGLTAVPWNASWDAEVQSEANDALVAFFTSSAQLVDDIWDEAQSGHVAGGSMGRGMQIAGTILTETTVTGTPTTTTCVLAAGSAVDDFYNDMEIIPLSGALTGQSRIITDYTGASRTVTVDEAWTSAMSASDAVIIRPRHTHTKTQIADAVWANTATELSAVPGASPTMEDAIQFLYMALRNRRDTTATADEIHNDAGTVIATSTLSDDATTFTKGEYA